MMGCYKLIIAWPGMAWSAADTLKGQRFVCQICQIYLFKGHLFIYLFDTFIYV